MRQTILSTLLALSPMLAFGQAANAPYARQPAPAQTSEDQLYWNQGQTRGPVEISCVGNFGKKYTLTVPASRFITPEDPGYGRAYDFKALNATGCGYDTVAPVPQDTQAFRK